MESHLRSEKHPFTQDSVLLESLAQARHQTLRRDLQIALRLEQDGVLDTKTIGVLMDQVFERHAQQSAQDHMAEEMELVLESYGKIATRRVLDRSPMICWEALRNLGDAIQDSLWSVTDDVLWECMQDSPEFVSQYQALQKEVAETTKALDILESL